METQNDDPVAGHLRVHTSGNGDVTMEGPTTYFFTPTQARDLAAMLVAKADEAEKEVPKR